jgi:hypothetical protein
MVLIFIAALVVAGGVLMLSRKLGIDFSTTFRACALSLAALVAVFGFRYALGRTGHWGAWGCVILALVILAWGDAGAAMLMNSGESMDFQLSRMRDGSAPWEPAVPAWYSWARYLVPAGLGAIAFGLFNRDAR